MKIEVKATELTKSKILQMDYIGVPKDTDCEVLGWVNIDKKRYVIIKSNNCYYRATYIKEVIHEAKGVQFALIEGGYEYPILTNVSYIGFNGGKQCISPSRYNSENEDLCVWLTQFKSKTINAGQIYY